MAYYFEAVDLGVWRVTRGEIKPIKNPDKPTKSEKNEIHLNVSTQNFRPYAEDTRSKPEGSARWSRFA